MISSVTVQGFRGISRTQVFTPGLLTILTGRNGLGKTTFFDAVDWCLFGEASRLGSQRGLIKNLYSSDSRASVEVVLSMRREIVTVMRTEDGVTLNGSPASERDLAEALIPDPSVFPPYLRELGKQVRTVTYLPQEQIRNFVYASLTSERKALLQGLLGVPNAGVVESSIKRVRDHFSARQKSLIEEVNSLESELHQLATTVEIDPNVERDAAAFMALFQSQHNEPSTTIEGVRVALEAELTARENNAALLDNAIATFSETVTTLAQVNTETTALEQKRAALLRTALENESKVSELTASIGSALIAQQGAAREIAAQEDRIATLVALLGKKERFDFLAEELSRQDSARDVVISQSTALKNSASALRLELQAVEKLADESRVQTRLAQERDAIEKRRVDVSKRLSALQDERRSKETQLDSDKRAQAEISHETAEALAAKNEASASHEQAMRSAQRSAQISDVRKKLISLIDIADSHCPLCGADYTSHDQLLEHLLRTVNATGPGDQLQNASDSLTAAEAKVLEIAQRARLQLEVVERGRTDLERIEREIAQLNTQSEGLDQSLQRFAEPFMVKPSGEALTRLDELRANVDEAELALSKLDQDLRSIMTKRTGIASELEDLKSGGAEAQFPQIAADTLSEARETLTLSRKELGALDQAYRELRDSHALRQSRLSDTRSEIAATEGRLNAESGRRARVLEELKRECESVGLPGIDMQSIGSELQRQSQRLQSEIGELRSQVGRARGIERRQMVNESAIKQRTLQKRLVEVQESLSALQQARNRFQLVAEGLATRSKAEAGSAGAHHLAAIQECVNDLYPHRHLNEVEIDFGEGELLVKDRWLTKGVRPQDYSSTGQANVLALSVFLGLALRQTFSLARFLLLDEPVQNLDDLHFLAFLTLLKRVALSRQVIISTADSNVTEILRRQLRSWSTEKRTWCEYEWVAFDPKIGPTINKHEGKRMAVAS
jgi:exonuclease SbcC